MNETDIQPIKHLLPHGSGINGTWQVNIPASGKTGYFSNTFSAMDDMGGYCHDYEFTVSIHKQKDGKYVLRKLNFKGQRERACCGHGLRSYLDELIFETLEEDQREQ